MFVWMSSVMLGNCTQLDVGSGNIDRRRDDYHNTTHLTEQGSTGF